MIRRKEWVRCCWKKLTFNSSSKAELLLRRKGAQAGQFRLNILG